MANFTNHLWNIINRPFDLQAHYFKFQSALLWFLIIFRWLNKLEH